MKFLILTLLAAAFICSGQSVAPASKPSPEAVAAAAAKPPAPHVSELQLERFNSSQLQDEVADLHKKLGELEKQAADLRRQLVRMQACDEAGILPHECSINANLEITRSETAKGK